MHSQNMVPPRIHTAPLNPGAAGASAGRLAAAAHAMRGNLPSAARRAPTSVGEGPQASEQRPSPPVETHKPQAFAAALGRKDMMEDYYPANCVYEVDQFLRLSHYDRAPHGITQYAIQIWRERPELQNELSDTSSMRESLFRDNNATMPSKVLTERKLHNEVLGILGKVTEANMDVMKVELTNLPIRQSTEDEIREVIMVFFNKSTRPEESRYAPLYVELIGHLITSIGEGEPASQMIRKEIIRQCRTTFLEGFDGSAKLEAEVANLTEEEAALAQMQFTGKQKANICFLGLLFCSDLVVVRVVRAVLDNLLYGDGKRRHTPKDYNVTHFMDLLMTCGPHLDESWNADPLPRYEQTLLELSRTHPQMRIRFLLENFVETMNNNWVPLHGRGAKPPAPGQARPVARPVMSTAPEPKLIEREEFWHLVDNYFTTSSVEEIVKVMADVPAPTVLAYFTEMLSRYIITTRYSKERARLGEFFKDLIARQAITAENAQIALLRQVQRAVKEDLFSDAPRYFIQWSEVIKNGLDVFPVSMHTEMLNMLVDSHAHASLIKRMVTDVSKYLEESKEKDYNPSARFRVLQALLRYTPALLAEGEEDEEMSDDDDDDVTMGDIVETIGNKEIDVEVTMFYNLSENFTQKSSVLLAEVTDVLKKTGNNAFPLLSAFFTFARYDIDALCTTYKDVLKKLFSQRPAHALLEEVYVQWKSLRCPDKMYFNFVKKLIALGVFPQKENVDKLKERLRTQHGAEALVVRLEQELSNKN